MKIALIAALLVGLAAAAPARAEPPADPTANSPASPPRAEGPPAEPREAPAEPGAGTGAEEEGSLPETPKLPVDTERFSALFKAIAGSAAAQSAHRSCPADVFDKVRPFWRRWWDTYVGDTNLPLETCGDDPMSCAFMCLTLRGADACFTAARVIQDNAGEHEQGYAQALFAYACALGYPAGCTNRAAGVKNGGYEGDPMPDPEKPETATCLFRSFSVACARRDAWGCTMHGMSLQYGEGVAADAEAARRAYDKSCDIDPAFAACETARDQVKQMDAPAPPPGPETTDGQPPQERRP